MPADGADNYAMIQEATDAIHLPNHLITIIAVAPGRYCEALYIPETINLIILSTACTETTVISFGNSIKHIHHHQARRLIGMGQIGGCGLAACRGFRWIRSEVADSRHAKEVAVPGRYAGVAQHAVMMKKCLEYEAVDSLLAKDSGGAGAEVTVVGPRRVHCRIVECAETCRLSNCWILRM